MNVLSISGDGSLGHPADTRLGDAMWRQRLYAGLVDHLTVVVVAQGEVASGVTVDGRLTIIRVCRRTRWQAARTAVARAVEACRASRVQCIATQDPFTTGWVGWQVARRTGLPLNVHIPADMLFNPRFLAEHPRNWLKHALGWWVAGRAATIRVASHAERKRLVRWGVRPNKIWVVPFLIDLDRFAAMPATPPRPPTVGFLGRLAAQKDPALFLSAASLIAQRIPACEFVMIGDGPQRASVERAARRPGLDARVRVLGGVRYAEVPAALAACDVVVSTSRYEGMPMALLEAAAAGKPVVATRTAGALEAVVDGSTGWLVDIGDARAVADKVTDVLSDPALARRMGEAGRSHITRAFAVERHVARYRDMWDATRSAACA